MPKSELMAVYRKDSSNGAGNAPPSQKCGPDNDDALSSNAGGGRLSGHSHSNNNELGSVHDNFNNNNNNNNVVDNNNQNNNNNSGSSCGGNNNNNNNNNSGNSLSSCSNSNSANDNSGENFLFSGASPHFMLNNETKFSPPPHLLSPRSNASSTPATPSADGAPSKAAASATTTRRRVRRRATSSSDPAEQLTEMSVRGLNLFRYACIDDGVYKCLECAKTDIVKTFKNKYSFQRHAFLYHEGCQRKVFPCLVCSKEFSRPDKMKNHMKTVHDCFMPKECVVPKECLFPPPPPTIPFFLSPP